MERKRLSVLVALVLPALVLFASSSIVACSSSTTPRPSSSSTAQPSAIPSSSPSPTVKPSPLPSPSASPSPTVNRQEQLEAAAKKEGAVTFWATYATEANKYLAPFKERYPWLKVEVWQSTNAPIVDKMLAEAKASKYSVDVFGLAEETAVQVPASFYAKYDWPSAAKWPAETRQQEGLYLRTTVNAQGPVYNTKAVPAAEIPKTWEDMANPRWKGRTVVSLETDEAVLVLAAMWGEGKEGKLDWDRALSFWQNFFKNTQPKTGSGFTTPTKLMVAGEYDLFPYGSVNAAVRMKATEGSPLGFIPVQYPARPSVLAIAKDAPHPNAARLLADYMTSDEGSVLFSNTMYMASLSPAAENSIPLRMYAEMGLKRYILPAALMTAENTKKSGELWKKLLGV
ncbi:MAG: extracellular solute-binding protein [Chloroflexi bacterium]|nr:extracellular solute-binding protein [Chloroflexota bacterium]